MNVLNSSIGLFAEADQSTLTRGHRGSRRRYASSGCPRDLLMLVPRYHGVWIIVPAFNEEPVGADVIADLRPVQSIRPPSGRSTEVAP
jgi:hypothetical protein